MSQILPKSHFVPRPIAGTDGIRGSRKEFTAICHDYAREEMSIPNLGKISGCVQGRFSDGRCPGGHPTSGQCTDCAGQREISDQREDKCFCFRPMLGGSSA